MKYRVTGSVINHGFTVELAVPQFMYTPSMGDMFVTKVTFGYHVNSAEDGIYTAIRLSGVKANANGEMGRRPVTAIVEPGAIVDGSVASEFEVWLRAMAAGNTPDYDAQVSELVPRTKDGSWET